MNYLFYCNFMILQLNLLIFRVKLLVQQSGSFETIHRQRLKPLSKS
jgi:hypothetical protein